MNLQMLGESKLVADLGWTLLHSFWQIGLVSLGVLIALRVLRDHSPNLRYALSTSALALSVLLPVITFVQASTNGEIVPSSVRSTTASGHRGDRHVLRIGESAVGEPQQPISIAGEGGSGLFAVLFRWIDRTLPDLLQIAVAAWLVGVAIFSLRLGGGFSRLRKYTTEGANEADAYWQHAFALLRNSAAVKRTVRLVRSELVQTPIAIGVLRPIIIIPASLFLQMSPRELEMIIAHELIHIRRFDPLVNLLQCIVEALFFYHPGVWWISGQMRREREFVTDAGVTQIFKDSYVTYARALANLEEIRLLANQQMPRYATAANGGNFMQRIQRILKIKPEASTANSAWTAGLALLLTSGFLLAIFSFSPSGLVNAERSLVTRKLAIGFVSIPPVDRTENPPKDSDATARLLIHKLKVHRVPATGFLQGGMISDGEKFFPVQTNIARMWIDAGFEVGLGGFNHMKLYNTNVDEYIANIEKNERVAKKLIGEMGLPPRYFSYPFLNTGRTVADKAKVEAWLASRGYTSVKYTFDNQEWMYSFAYDIARNDNDVNTMKEIRELYLAYLNKMFDHFEAYSTEMFGRDIPQTMVLTPSRLITDTADEFFGMATKRGYTFITVDEAQTDPAYKTKEDFTGVGGISWFERWTMAKGHRLREEPGVDASIVQTWDNREQKSKK
ncbi:MAG: polysaccharide deacetylase family protein [Blastocatellia bacterium]|nr:polysaccharide deacetylase family protein [Blastocatellia bacterium]